MKTLPVGGKFHRFLSDVFIPYSVTVEGEINRELTFNAHS
jgi:hypothetical protein